MVKNSKIKKIKAREILDSRGNPTVEVELTTNLGIFLASVPSGVSTGKYEAVELRDGGKRYQGRGVLKAVRNVNKIIAPKLKGRDPTRQKETDNFLIKLDGTKNKSKLGANAILAVSLAVCRAGAAAKNLLLWKHISQLAENSSPRSLPSPSILLIEGGAHAGNELDFQEFMIVPREKTFSKNLQIASEIYQELKEIIKDYNPPTASEVPSRRVVGGSESHSPKGERAPKYIDLGINVGDEGGFAPPVRVPEEALELIMEATEKAGYQKKIKIILDIAASQFYTNGKYKMKFGDSTIAGLLRYYSDLIQKYPIIALEDPFSEEDWEGWKKLNAKCKMQNAKLLVIGDDLTVTNPERIKQAYERKACNGIIIKPNQIGTVSETIGAAKLAKSFGWRVMVSHRSGETMDDFIVDLAVGIGADFIKAGAPSQIERMVKYNRLLEIEKELRSVS